MVQNGPGPTGPGSQSILTWEFVRAAFMQNVRFTKSKTQTLFYDARLGVYTITSFYGENIKHDYECFEPLILRMILS